MVTTMCCLKRILLLLIIVIVELLISVISTNNKVPTVATENVRKSTSAIASSFTSTISNNSITSTSSNDKTKISDATISITSFDSIKEVMWMNSSSINSNSTRNSSSSSSSSPPKSLIEYPYQPSDQDEIDKLAGIVKNNTVLRTLPKNLTYSYLEKRPPRPPEYRIIRLTDYKVSVNNPKRHRIIRIPNGQWFNLAELTPKEQAQAKLAQLTNTEAACYDLPPTNISLEDMAGFWYIVRKVNSKEGTDYKYICEEVIYTVTSPTTFNKVSDVHFHGKWMTIHGNGTYIAPGIVIIDWAVLDDPSKPDRLVFTVLGSKYDQWLIGYDCLTGKMRPEVVLQTRHKKVRAKYLHQAYSLIHKDKLPLDDMVCETGFKSSVFSKSNSHASHK